MQQTLGDRYRIEELLGEGASARVYRVWDESLEVARAVKILRPMSDEARERLRMRLRREARLMARLEHPNILQIYDVQNSGTEDYVVMALAEGASLQHRLDERGPLPLEEAVRAILQVLSALHAAHEAGIVHRDVKPQNILLSRVEQALLSDFGIALHDEGMRHTQAGVAMGSMAYMAPEQRLDAHEVTAAADLYAVGATLYYLVTGATPVDLCMADPASPRWAEVPPPLREVLQVAMHLDPNRRYKSAQQMAQALCTACGRLAPPLPKSTGWPPFVALALERMESRSPPPAARGPLPPAEVTFSDFGLGPRASTSDPLPTPTVEVSVDGVSVGGGSASGSGASAEPHPPTLPEAVAPTPTVDDSAPAPAPASAPAAVLPKTSPPLPEEDEFIESLQPVAEPDPGRRRRGMWQAAGILAATAMGFLVGAWFQQAPVPLDPDPSANTGQEGEPVRMDGRWQGQLAGLLEAELLLDGQPDALQGVMTIYFGEAPKILAISGKYDPQTRQLRLWQERSGAGGQAPRTSIAVYDPQANTLTGEWLHLDGSQPVSFFFERK